MPNRNYISGRAFEYKRKKAWEERGYTVIRASGSHGRWDLVAVKPNSPVVLIQCKKCMKASEVNGLINEFKEQIDGWTKHYHEVIEIWVKETRKLVEWYG